MKYVIWAASVVCAMAIMVLVWTDHLVVAAVAFMASMAILVGLRLLEHQQSGSRVSAATTGSARRET